MGSLQGNSDKRTVYRNTVMLYVMTASKFILPVIITAFLARRLGGSDYGVIVFETSVMNYFLLFFEYGFVYSATRKISQNRDDASYVQSVINNVFTAKLLLVACSCLPFLMLTLFVPLMRDNVFLSVAFFLSTASNVFLPDFVYRGHERMEYITIRYVLGRAVSAVLIILFVWSSAEMALVPLFYLLGTLAACAYSLKNLKDSFGHTFHVASFSSALNELKDSTVFFLSSIATTGLSVFTTFVLGISGIEALEIAFWGLAIQVVQAIQALIDPVASSIFPSVSKSGDISLSLKATAAMSIFGAVAAIAVFCFAELVIGVLGGSGYEAAADVLKLLAPVVLLSFPAQMLGFPTLGAMGRQKQVTITTWIAALFQMISTILLLVMPWGLFCLASVAVLRNASELILLLARLRYALILLRDERRYRNARQVKP